MHLKMSSPKRHVFYTGFNVLKAAQIPSKKTGSFRLVCSLGPDERMIGEPSEESWQLSQMVGWQLNLSWRGWGYCGMGGANTFIWVVVNNLDLITTSWYLSAFRICEWSSWRIISAWYISCIDIFILNHSHSVTVPYIIYIVYIQYPNLSSLC